MSSKRYPTSSTTSGKLLDGALEGQINESLHEAVISNVQLATNKFVLRMDFDKGTFSDISSAINANTPTALMGATADLSVGDGFIVACDDEVMEIGLNLTTPGVGTWTGIKIYDSTDGLTFNREITGFTDNTNVLKGSGWRDIILPANAFSGRVAMTPSPVLGITSRKWVLVKISNASFSVTTAPIVSGMYIKHYQVDQKWLSLTTTSNGSLTAAPTGVQFHPSIGSRVAYFFDGLPVGWERYVFQEQPNVRTRVLKYATNSAGTEFADVTGLSDPSNDFTVVPSSSPQKFSVRWTPPTAVRVSTTFNMSDSTVLTITNKYMFIIETTAVTSVAPVNPTLSRVRVKMLGTNGTSGSIVSAHNLKRVTITRHGLSTGSGVVSFQLYNYTQERSVDMSFPDTDDNIEQNYDIADMAFADGDRRGLYHASGSRIINDLEIEYHV